MKTQKKVKTAKTITPVVPAKKAKEVNYTPEMIEQMKAQAPLNYAKAESLAIALNRNIRSIIAKAKREGIEYLAKQPEPKKRTGPTKLEMVQGIEKHLNRKMVGLDKVPVATLQALQELLIPVIPE